MRSEGKNPVTIHIHNTLLKLQVALPPWRFAQSVRMKRVVLNALEVRLDGLTIVSPRRDNHQRACLRAIL